MSLTFAQFDFHNKDYSFERAALCLRIQEKNKTRTERSKAEATAKQLSTQLKQLKEENRAISLRTQNEIDLFIEKLRGKLEATLSKEHPYLGPLYRLLQYLFSCGPFYELSRCEKELHALSVGEKDAVQVERQDLEALGWLQLNKTHEKVIKLFQIDQCRSEQELLDKLKVALETSDVAKLLFKCSVEAASSALLVQAFSKSQKLAMTHLRFVKLQSATFETRATDCLEWMRIAFFIAAKFKKDKLKNAFFHASKTTLTHHIQFDATKRDFYVISKPEFSVLREPDKDSTFKRVCACVKVSENEQPGPSEIAACLFTKTDGLPKSVINKDVKNTLLEVEFWRKFTGVRGLAHFRCAAPFTDQGERHVSLLFTRRTGNLFKRIYRNKRPLSFHEKLLIAKDLISGLEHLHRNKTFHADVKPQNALYQENQAGIIERAEHCDLGFAFEDNDDRAALHLPQVFKLGHAGDVGLSAPEFYAETNFKGSFYATDVWCLGCVLFQVLHARPPSWKADIKAHEKKNFDGKTGTYKDADLLKKTKEDIAAKIEAEIETRLAALQAKPPTSVEEKLELLILQMMQLRPEKRPPIALSLQEVLKL